MKLVKSLAAGSFLILPAPLHQQEMGLPLYYIPALPVRKYPEIYGVTVD